MNVEEKLIIRLESMNESFQDSLKEFNLQKGDVDKSTKRFIAHMETLDEKIKDLDEKFDYKLETSLATAFDEQKDTIRHIIDREIKETLSPIRKEAEKTIREITNVRVEDRFRRYMTIGAFCLGMFGVSMGIQWYFPLKNEYNYHLSKDMMSQIRMGEYTNIALDSMDNKRREDFLKYIERAASSVLRNKYTGRI